MTSRHTTFEPTFGLHDEVAKRVYLMNFVAREVRLPRYGKDVYRGSRNTGARGANISKRLIPWEVTEVMQRAEACGGHGEAPGKPATCPIYKRAGDVPRVYRNAAATAAAAGPTIRCQTLSATRMAPR